MKIHYYPETDSLYIELQERLVVDLDAKGDVVGFDVDRASQRFDLSTLETIGLPVKTTRAAWRVLAGTGDVHPEGSKHRLQKGCQKRWLEKRCTPVRGIQNSSKAGSN